METLRDHWVTGLALLGAAFLVVTGIAMVVTGGEDGTADIRVFGAISVVAGVAVLAGLQGLRTGRLDVPISYALVVIGMVWLAAGFWWFVFVPPLLGFAVVYAGVFRKRLQHELAPA